MIEDEFRRAAAGCRRLLIERLADPAPGRIQILTGPRQVGKTTLLLDLAQQLGNGALYVAADSPEAAVAGFWDRLWAEAEEQARERGKLAVLLDEVQHLPDWAARLEGEWDRLRRRRLPVHVVASGSSALRLGAGSRESLAGRFERLTLAHWSARALVEELGAPRRTAADLVVRLGSYPGAFALRADFPRWRAYVRDAIAEPAIGRDLLALGVVRRPALLRQLLALCTALPAQIVSLQKLQGSLQGPGALETIAHYLHLLEEAYLVAALEKHSTRPLRRRAAQDRHHDAVARVPDGRPAAADPARQARTAVLKRRTVPGESHRARAPGPPPVLGLVRVVECLDDGTPAHSRRMAREAAVAVPERRRK